MRKYRLAKRADRFGDLQADAYHSRLEHCFQLLADQPYLGRQHKISEQSVRVFFHEHHVIVYQVSEAYILIARVLSTRRNWQRILHNP